ncbi:aminoglycoside phosphotransferase [Frankia sp. CcI49]|nr:aminoglycoside phosphotransferase [Frankia sp. CcI49]
MTDVLRAGGLDAEVTGVRFEPVGTGQTAVSYRFHLDGRGADGRGAPASLVVKMAAGAPDVRRRLRSAYRNEVGFYAYFAHRAAIRTPRCWYAAVSDDLLRFTLVLDDACPAEAGSQLDGCSPARATIAVRNLAGLHAPFWNAENLGGEEGFGKDAPLGRDTAWPVRADERGMAYLGKVVTAAAAEFTERYREQLEPEDAETLLRAAALVSGWGRHTATRHSLIHGDYRLDNLLFTGDSDVQAVDWQTLEIGFPGRDLAYFLSTALAPAQRRAQEVELVAAYHDQLVEYGVTGYSGADCFEDYRRGMLQGPLITMIGCVYASAPRTDSSDRMFLSMATNAARAIRDLGVLDLLSASA